MKNATKHAEELRSLFKRLTKDARPAPPEKQEPLRALVRAAMSFDVPDAKAEEALKLIDKEFVDLNELRVATQLEVQEMLGQRYPQIERRVNLITTALNYIFEKEHTLSLERLKTLKWREARQFVREIPEMTPFVEAYVVLHAFDGPAFPLDDETLAYLRDANVVGAEATAGDAQKFVESHLKAEDVHPFFAAARKAVFDESKTKKKAK